VSSAAGDSSSLQPPIAGILNIICAPEHILPAQLHMPIACAGFAAPLDQIFSCLSLQMLLNEYVPSFTCQWQLLVLPLDRSMPLSLQVPTAGLLNILGAPHLAVGST
jgi:hypothetical protein